MIGFQQLINSLKGPVFFINTELQIKFVNHAFCQFTGYKQEECLNQSFQKIIAENSFNKVLDYIKKANKNTTTSPLQIKIVTKSGPQKNIDLSVFPEFKGNELEGYSAYFNESTIDFISDKTKTSKTDLFDIKEEYKTLYNLTFEGIIIHDKGIIIDANPAFKKMMGYSENEIAGKNIINLCVLPEYRSRITEAMQKETSEPYEVLARRKDGVVIQTEVESREIRFNDRKVRVTAIRDITSRKEAEKELLDSEERYRLLSNITFEGIFLHDKGIIVDANESLAKMIGYDIDEIIGKNIIELVVLPEYHQRVITALQNEETIPYVVKVRRKDGSVFYAEVEAGMVNHKGKWLRVTAARDVTWRIETERKLRENEEELDTFFTQSADGFFIMKLDKPVRWDPKNKNEKLLQAIMTKMAIAKINDAMVNQYRTQKSRIENYSLEQFFHWNDLYGKNFTRELLDKGFIKFEMAEPRFDNSIMWIEGNYLVLYDENGKVRGCCGVRREISDRKKAEEKIKKHNAELKKANQELDNFVYKVSHDLKAPIASAKGLINIARLETEKKRLDSCLNLIDDSMNRLDSFILDILDYSRNSRVEIKPELIDFERLIKDTLAHIKYLQIENKIEVESEINDKISFFSDRQRLVFIFNNLISNAVRFIDEEKKDSYLKIKIDITKEKARIKFLDNGIGIDKEHQDRIFEMFYRASDQKVGSGLGLYIVKESLEKLKGHIEVESKPGIGTKFKLEIPNLIEKIDVHLQKR